MPELAEVAFHASKWKAAVGQRFRLDWISPKARCCRHCDADTLRSALDDSVLKAGYTHGKRMLFSFGDRSYLEIHLGMTGSLRRENLDYERVKHDHLVLRGERTLLVFQDSRQFGKVAFHRTEGDLPAWWRELPPQPHDEQFTPERFEEILSRSPRSVLKAFLLKQEYFPGVGNWMADEILWQARVRPSRKVESLSKKESDALFEKLRFVCAEAIRTIGGDYSDPPETWLFQHRWKDGGDCPATGKPLVRETIGGRTTCWSPAWQR
ncbi:DNA-formamidopyrimidine glycosylase family protein [Pelagicoccus sp. SDUM812003]|uniref:Fpg/Nei family DNA glycosylase n=1 Tax=Pelagicoccus sp. SDUM812003 TaxID=3041267 RepID=UPI00280CADBA|nr:DNA-formamidopyrimidine glycosylase family protein [Pelagicoccus sp. SDUM812003]MDQ8203922.1 DNA-formamidopyrimidine glycosylase family protein [Pelagicoccus sp. SDUM812003]